MALHDGKIGGRPSIGSGVPKYFQRGDSQAKGPTDFGAGGNGLSFLRCDIEPPQTVCDSCTPAAAPPPVRSLWRLGRFARPRAAMIVLGFGLTFAGTAAGLVPPYLTMPLLDKVLIPFQAGLPVDFGLMPWYLGGLFASWWPGY